MELPDVSNMQDSDKHRVHACFRLDIQFPITVESDGDLFELWHSLSYRIMRQPQDLLAHTRRIRLCHEPALNDRLAGALMDLDHVLDGRGNALRQRLRSESMRAVGDIMQLPELHASGDNHHASQKGRVLPTMTRLLETSNATGRASSLS